MVIDQPLKKEDKAYSTDTSINQIILWMTRECKSLRRFTTVRKIQPCSPQLAEQRTVLDQGAWYRQTVWLQ